MKVEGIDYKIRCAQCLLHSTQNAFVCIHAKEKEVLKKIVNEAEIASNQITRMHDHCHFFVCVHFGVLLNQDKKTLLEKVMEDNIDLESKYECYETEIKIGNMLDIYINLMNDSTRSPSAIFGNKIILIGYEDISTEEKNKVTFNINLPGGKRNMGETSFACAFRELKEETSIVIQDGDFFFR